MIGAVGVAAVAAAVRSPVFAIGGVEPERIPELKAHGVRRVCAIRSLAATPDPEGQARVFCGALEA